MLAKALATGFNSPFVSIPGSGFAATFIGIDAIIVRVLARRAKRLARKWGGQCIVFIDEIDAVGMRRQALDPGSEAPQADRDRPTCTTTSSTARSARSTRPATSSSRTGSGASGSSPSARRSHPARPAFVNRMNGVVNFMFPGGMGGGSLALNQLLVVMDGIDNPPFFKKLFTNKTNTLLDGIYIVPRRIGKRSLRLPAARPRREQIYFIGATNVPVDRLDPALTRPGRMGRHVWFRTPTKQDRLDVLDLYLGKVAHEPELDQPHKRDEIARVTNGYAPAMIEQVTSMALTIAHHSDREALTWDDLVEAMTTLESGTAVGIEYIPEESRAVAIHEAGHAAAGHVYMKGAESTRLSIRMRGGALGHHQALEKEERFSRFRSEEFARLVWALGAMAAERVFYGENSNGVGGDVMSVTAQAAYMVGASAMGPEPFAVTPRDDETEEEARERVLKRFEKIGLQIVNRTSGGGPFAENPIGVVLVRPRQARARRPDRRPGVRRRPQPRRPQPRRGRAHRRRAHRAARALRRRAHEPARRVEDHDPRGRPVGGELMADDVMDKAAADAKPVPGTPLEHPESPSARVARRARAARFVPESLFGLLRRPCDGRGDRCGGAARPRRPREPCPRSRLVGVGADRNRGAPGRTDRRARGRPVPTPERKSPRRSHLCRRRRPSRSRRVELPGARDRRTARHDRRPCRGERHRHRRRAEHRHVHALRTRQGLLDRRRQAQRRA